MVSAALFFVVGIVELVGRHLGFLIETDLRGLEDFQGFEICIGGDREELEVDGGDRKLEEEGASGFGPRPAVLGP